MKQPDTAALRERLANYTPEDELEQDKQAVRTYEQRTTIRYQVSEISAFYPDCW